MDGWLDGWMNGWHQSGRVHGPNAPSMGRGDIQVAKGRPQTKKNNQPKKYAPPHTRHTQKNIYIYIYTHCFHLQIWAQSTCAGSRAWWWSRPPPGSKRHRRWQPPPPGPRSCGARAGCAAPRAARSSRKRWWPLRRNFVPRIRGLDWLEAKSGGGLEQVTNPNNLQSMEPENKTPCRESLWKIGPLLNLRGSTLKTLPVLELCFICFFSYSQTRPAHVGRVSVSPTLHFTREEQHSPGGLLSSYKFDCR